MYRSSFPLPRRVRCIQAEAAEIRRAVRRGAGDGSHRHSLRHRGGEVRALDVARHRPQRLRPPLLGALDVVLLPCRFRR